MYKGDIIDTHMHLWNLNNNYPWLNNKIREFEQLIGNYDSLRHNFLPNDYKEMIKGHDIVQSVHVQAFGFPNNPILESKWLQEQANYYKFPQGIIAFANLADSNINKILEQHTIFSNIRGIRMPLNYHKIPYFRMAERRDYMQNSQWRKGFALLAHYSLSFDVQIYDHQINDVIALARIFPNVKLIIEHFGWPTDLTYRGFKVWKKRIAGLTPFSNVLMKLSGIGCVFQRRISNIQINHYIDVAIETLGINRCIFGSNCPPDILFYTFDELIDFYKKAFLKYSQEDQHKLFYLNAKNFYRL